MGRHSTTKLREAKRLMAPPWRTTQSKVWVVLPAYNESRNIGNLLERIDIALFEAGLNYHVILVNDGSTDKTLDVVKKYSSYIPLQVEVHKGNRGLGATIRDGLYLASKTCGERDVVIAMDADNTHTPALIQSMVRLVREGSDVVIASRYQPGSEVRGVPVSRRILSYLGSLLFRVVFPTHGIRDYTCGYRAYRGGILKEAFQQYGDQFVSEGGFQCTVDILLKLRHMDALFREIPLILRYDFKRGASKMKVLSTIFRTLSLLVRRRLQR